MELEIELESRTILKNQILFNLHVFIIIRVDNGKVTPAIN